MEQIAFDPHELADKLPDTPLPPDTWAEISERLDVSSVPLPYVTEDGDRLLYEVNVFAPHEDTDRTQPVAQQVGVAFTLHYDTDAEQWETDVHAESVTGANWLNLTKHYVNEIGFDVEQVTVEGEFGEVEIEYDDTGSVDPDNFF